MKNQADIRLINPHPKRRGADHDGLGMVHPSLLAKVPLLGCQPRMVGLDGITLAREVSRQFFAVPTRTDIDQGFALETD